MGKHFDKRFLKDIFRFGHRPGVPDANPQHLRLVPFVKRPLRPRLPLLTTYDQFGKSSVRLMTE
jgi:hypothetical protein